MNSAMNATRSVSLFAAVGTPLAADESLHEEAMKLHVEDQWRAGMTGVLIGGTMGAMQLLGDATYRELVEVGTHIAAGHGEVMVGVGDAGFARTRDRLRFVNRLPVDGVVVLSPYLIKFAQDELIDYFRALADVSSRPLYLYDLPVLTGTKLSLETVLTLAVHPNIRGIKCSCELGWTRQLRDLAPEHFRVIFAQADLVDTLLRSGVTQHLDGVFALAPDWTAGIGRAAAAGDWDVAASLQRKLSALLRVMREYGVFQTFTALLNARGIPGNYAPSPFRQLDAARRERLLSEAVVRDLLAATSGATDADVSHRDDNGKGRFGARAITAGMTSSDR